MTDSIIPDVPVFADAISPLKRAELGLQDELSVFEIGLLTYPDKDADKKRRQLVDFLLSAIKARQLLADGNPDGERCMVYFSPEGKAQVDGPLSYALRHEGTRKTLRQGKQPDSDSFGSVQWEEQAWHGNNCLVTWMDYQVFLATPVAKGIPKPYWPACPKIEEAMPYVRAKVYLNATDADMCAWTLLSSSLTVYQKCSSRLERFEWPNTTRNDKPLLPWQDQLALLWFSRVELEHFHPDNRYLTGEEAINRVQRGFPSMACASIEDRLMAKAWPGKDQINFDLIPISPYPLSDRNRKTLRLCIFQTDQIDQFAREYCEDHGAAQPYEQGAVKQHKRIDALGEAIEAAIEVLSLDGRLPTPAQMFKYLRTQDKTGVVAAGESKEVIYWVASNGNKQSTSIENITKRLNRMKKRN